VALYGQVTGRVAAGKLRAALDSSPLGGAGRVEDTSNLLGHALRTVVGVLARQQGGGWRRGPGCWPRGRGAELGRPASRPGWTWTGTTLLRWGWCSGWSVGWRRWSPSWQAGRIRGGRRAPGGAAGPRSRRRRRPGRGCDHPPGVARDRRISVEDSQMRHGRKAKRVRIDGYKRHVLTDLETALVPAVRGDGCQPRRGRGRSPDHRGPGRPATHRSELHSDRAYLSSSLVCDRDPDLGVCCKAFPVRNGPASPSPRSPSTSTRDC
jgi:hypothetical protein